MDPHDGTTVYAATASQGVFRTRDGAVSWAGFNEGLTSLQTRQLAIDRGGLTLHAGTTTGVFDRPLSDDVSVLRLDAGRDFSVRLEATDRRTGRTAPGLAIAQNNLFGYFSIPGITGDPSNPEVFVKILDGRSVNGQFWVFYGGLTDLEYSLAVTDDATGRQRTYVKPMGSACGGYDAAAFSP